MSNKLECRPVLLPAGGKYAACTSHEGNYGIYRHRGVTDTLLCNDKEDNWDTQHLYLVSDREIKEGDWFMYGGVPTRLMQGLGSNFKDRIEASTDSSLGPPGIPQSFIEEYVAKQGKIDKVYLSYPSEAWALIFMMVW